MDATNLEGSNVIEGSNVNPEGLTVEVVRVWQVGSGICGDTLYFTDKAAAAAVSESQSTLQNPSLSERTVLRFSDGRAFLYHPVPILLNANVSELLRKNALKKLTNAEKEALGLIAEMGTEAAS